MPLKINGLLSNQIAIYDTFGAPETGSHRGNAKKRFMKTARSIGNGRVRVAGAGFKSFQSGTRMASQGSGLPAAIVVPKCTVSSDSNASSPVKSIQNISFPGEQTPLLSVKFEPKKKMKPIVISQPLAF